MYTIEIEVENSKISCRKEERRSRRRWKTERRHGGERVEAVAGRGGEGIFSDSASKGHSVPTGNSEPVATGVRPNTTTTCHVTRRRSAMKTRLVASSRRVTASRLRTLLSDKWRDVNQRGSQSEWRIQVVYRATVWAAQNFTTGETS